jgi:hypothetical protein
MIYPPSDAAVIEDFLTEEKSLNGDIAGQDCSKKFDNFVTKVDSLHSVDEARGSDHHEEALRG